VIWGRGVRAREKIEENGPFLPGEREIRKGDHSRGEEEAGAWQGLNL